ncbi:hypothetical protein FXB39_02390 [Nocardioides sp. BGMRC 2183]|nr:hypothetical protein FXB39_02390 [Nocardioides sp. BGMRC 2183]
MLTGAITQYFDALDRAWDDHRVRALTQPLGTATISDTHANDVAVRHVRFGETGVALELRGDRLTSVVFTVSDGIATAPGGRGTVRPFGREPRATYPWIDGLIDGMSQHSSRADVRALLGEPLRAWWAYDDYLVGERLLSVTFYGAQFDELREVTLRHEDPILLRYDDIHRSPVAKRRDGRIFLEVPVSLGAADTLWDFEITAEQLAALTDRYRFELLVRRLRGGADREKTRSIIDAVCDD